MNEESYVTTVPGMCGSWCAVVMIYNEREGGYVMDRSRMTKYCSKLEAERLADKLAFNENLEVR